MSTAEPNPKEPDLGTSYTPEGISEKGAQRVEAVLAYLKEKWGDPFPECPYCKTKEWTVDPVPVLLQRIGAPNPGFGVPAFAIFCDNCANSVLIPVSSIGGVWEQLTEIEPSELGLTQEQFDELRFSRGTE